MSNPKQDRVHPRTAEDVNRRFLQRIKDLEEFDAVVEQGTSGIWTYRKWKSGVAECWGEVSTNVEGGVEAGGDFRFTVAYPLSFAKVPIVFIHTEGKAYIVRKAYHSKPTEVDNNKNLVIYAKLEEGYSISADDNTVSFYVIVKGRWK